MKKRTKKRLIELIVTTAIVVGGCISTRYLQVDNNQETIVEIDDIPKYSGKAYIEINDNVPYFNEDDLTKKSFEKYSELDSLGRCGKAYANVSKKTMSTEKRGSIGQVKPSGWQTKKYDFVDGKYLYNRCHLIGYQLTGENANNKNLITGTRYMNTQGMLPFENKVANYVKETNHHVLYRVTPIYEGDNLVASGVLMEAMSVEDQGLDIEFNVFVYNVQPGVTINYKNGESYKTK
ncbi:MAG: DNA/RNA non-specific endonuclease [Longibaculum sp.]